MSDCCIHCSKCSDFIRHRNFLDWQSNYQRLRKNFVLLSYIGLKEIRTELPSSPHLFSWCCWCVHEELNRSSWGGVLLLVCTVLCFGLWSTATMGLYTLSAIQRHGGGTGIMEIKGITLLQSSATKRQKMYINSNCCLLKREQKLENRTLKWFISQNACILLLNNRE